MNSGKILIIINEHFCIKKKTNDRKDRKIQISKLSRLFYLQIIRYPAIIWTNFSTNSVLSWLVGIQII